MVVVVCVDLHPKGANCQKLSKNMMIEAVGSSDFFSGEF
jgi:hypothetical protein